MGKTKMNKTQWRRLGIIMLAYAHRYVYPILIMWLPLTTGKKSTAILGMGIGLILLALYDFIGYILRWKHIFCSYQNAYHQKMTPDRINWSLIKKSDAYGLPIIFGLLGLMCIFVYFYAS